MSDEYQWKQLGSAVNAVLMQARMQAVRSGSISRVAPTHEIAAREQGEATAHQAQRIQLELPLDLRLNSDNAQRVGAPRGVRLM